MGSHWIGYASWNRRQRCLVKDKINPSRRLTYNIAVHDVTDNEVNLRSSLSEILRVSSAQIVQDADVMALRQQSVHKVRPDEAGTTCYEANSHRLSRNVKAGK
jgi:hypothetical protein